VKERRLALSRLLAAAAFLLRPAIAPAFEYELDDGHDIQVHGFYEMQLRALSDGFRSDRWFLSQWSNVLDLEIELDLAPDGFGPFDLASAFVRAEVRMECVYRSVCGLDPSLRLYGDDARRQVPNLTDGERTGYVGFLPAPPDSDFASSPIHDENGTLVDLTKFSPFDQILRLGATNVDATFAPVRAALFAVKKIDADNPRGPRVLPLGPWRTDFELRSVGALASVPATTNPADPDPDDAVPGALLLRPRTQSLYTPSRALLERMPRFDAFDQNFREAELFWNRGASQDEGELKEAYLDLELFDHRLWLRIGKQTIVWGKTELFRTTDQFNPQDLAISSLPSLEESRIPLWSARGVWSLYEVGPLDDVRLEVAVNLDDFEPIDLGRCGEPYTVFLVCAKSVGLFAHGVTGLGIAGEERPENFWESSSGLELGARLEFRWDRLSFQISDFYGYDDAPFLYVFDTYERKVDPLTGHPLDLRGEPFDTSGVGNVLFPDDHRRVSVEEREQREALREQALAFQPGARQLFDLFCSASVGIAQNALEALEGLEDACLLDLFNNNTPLGLFGDTSTADAVGMILAGGTQGRFLLGLLVPEPDGSTPPVPLFELTRDAEDGERPSAGRNTPLCAGFGEGQCLSQYLTDAQQALLGCGAFYGTSCDAHGADLFNAEASVIFQRLPSFEPGGPVATRFAPSLGRVVQLPGARGPLDADYDPRVDGCTTADPAVLADAGHAAFCATSTFGDNTIFGVDDLHEAGFRSELDALSENVVRIFAAIAASLEAQEDPDTRCVPPGRPGYDPLACDLVLALIDVAGTRRPEVRAGGNGSGFGRRDFLWHGGGEAVLRYNKRNVLGLALDLAEDRFKSNWSVEATWFNDAVFRDTYSPTQATEADVFNLTLSVDRPTFVNFLNPHRTFFFNMQWFLRWIAGYRGDRGFLVDGPFAALGTFTVTTAYFQDRLLPAFTFVHDVRSASGGVITSLGYRYTESFSVTLGAAWFYGRPRRTRVADHALRLDNDGPPFLQRVNYQGLSPIAERDEVFLRVRYTF
jgi:hypothetical protein